MKKMLNLLMIIAISSTKYVACSLSASQSVAIFEAIEKSDRKAVEKMIEKNALLVNFLSPWAGTPLHAAARKANVFLDAWSTMPLDESEAARKANVSIIKLLLVKRANIEARDRYDKTPLHEAAAAKNESIIKLLLNKGASTEAQDGYGRTPLHIAASARSVELCELLISKNANISKKDIFGNTALHIAVLEAIISEEGSFDNRSYESEKVLRLFIKKGLNINEKNNEKYTPLHIATKRSDSRSCRLLIQKKADIDARDSNMRTALHLAVLKDDLYIVDILLTYRPSVDLRDEFGCEPLHYACLTGKCFAAFESFPNNLVETNLSEWNPLHIACFKSNSFAVETLLRQGVDVNRQIGESGKTALMIACQKGYKEVCLLLLSDEALDKDARDNDLGGTALDWASEFEHLEICKLLLDKGFTYKRLDEKFKLLRRACRNDHVGLSEVILDVFSLWDKVDDKGNSVLHYACTYGSKEVVECVLQKHKAKGLQVKSKNSGGKLAFHLAEENNLSGVVKLLTMYGMRPIEEKPEEAVSKLSVRFLKNLLNPFN